MDDLLSGLNAAQREAVTATEGYVRVIAGAGSGKTRALARRFAYLVNEVGTLPGNILCVTFTNKSAAEMRQRIHALTGDEDTGYICTFHSFCVTVLQEDSHAVQYPRRFLVLDNSDIDAMLRIIYEERGLTLRAMTFSAARDMIELRKLKKEPQYYLDLITLSLETLQQKYLQAEAPDDIIFYGYLYQQKKCFGLDYNDLLKFTLYIFEQDADIRLKWQQRLEYIMVDEFQDIDEPQYTLMQVLCGYHHNLFVVGDPDQTIYTWRGANIRYLLDFDQVFPGTRTILMMEITAPRRRSCPWQIRSSQKHGPHGKIPAPHPAGRRTGPSAPRAQRGGRGRVDGGADAGPARRRDALPRHDRALPGALSHTDGRGGAPAGENSLHHLQRRAVFGRAEIKDALSYLRMIACQDDLSFLRIVNQPKRNIGERRRRLLQEQAAQEGCSLFTALRRSVGTEAFRGTGAARFVSLIDAFSSDCSGRSVSEVLSAILHESGYEAMLRTEGSQERLDNLAELKQSVYEYETTCGEECTLEHYLAHVALFTNADAGDSRDRVKLMTVHTAKGLEFPHVFLCAMNEGLFPSKKIRTLPAMEEERRLAFVAMTRAEQGLYLSEAAGRNFDGTDRYPSRFLLDIAPGLLEQSGERDDMLLDNARGYIAMSERTLRGSADAAAFRPGQRVRHSILGTGTMLELDEAKQAWLIRFDGLPTPRRISFRARLTPCPEQEGDTPS